jgi:hypothetical protein
LRQSVSFSTFQWKRQTRGYVQRASPGGLRHHPGIPGKPIIIPGSDRFLIGISPEL